MIAMALQLLSSRSKLLNEEKRMKSSIWFAITFALMGFYESRRCAGKL
jgi:GNAT superfamily N-acetyltransferase